MQENSEILGSNLCIFVSGILQSLAGFFSVSLGKDYFAAGNFHNLACSLKIEVQDPFWFLLPVAQQKLLKISK